MIMLRLLLISAAVAILAAPLTAQSIDGGDAPGPRFYFAATPKDRPMRLDVARTPTLMRRITLDLADVTLEDALQTIVSKTGLKLSYGKSVVPLGRKVRISASEITLAGAIAELLIGEQIDVLFTQTGQAILLPRRELTAAMRVAGAISGRVIDSATNEGVSGATVIVLTTRQTVYTGTDGRFLVSNVPAGSHSISVRRLGYRTGAHPVTVDESATATVELRIARTPTVLSEVVTTATGDRQRLEVGNAVGTIKADSIVPTSLIRNMSDLLQARTPSVVVTNTTGMAGAPSRVRIRGVNSVQLNNDPIVVIDGVRVQSATTLANSQTNTGTLGVVTSVGSIYGSMSQAAPLAASRLDDLDPNMIESIDVLRGPSAASLYGTEAANGVIVIRTKRGYANSIRVSASAEDGSSFVPGDMPEAWNAWGQRYTGSPVGCPIFFNGTENQLTKGTCTQDSVTAFSPANHPEMTTLGMGKARSGTASLSGGNDLLQQFVSLRATDNLGVAKMSNVEARRIGRLWGSPPPWWMTRPNFERIYSGSSRTTLKAGSRFDGSLFANGVYRNVMGGDPAIMTTDLSDRGLQAPRGLWDTLQYLPAETQRQRLSNLTKRAMASLNGTYTPAAWLMVRGTVGGDYSLRTDDALIRSVDCTPGIDVSLAGGCTSGHQTTRGETFLSTAEFAASAGFRPRSWLNLRTTLGQQYARTTFASMRAGNNFVTNLAFGTDLITPAPTLQPGAAANSQLYNVTEARDASATAGWYVEQLVSLRERLYLRGALRQDAASAFGDLVNQNAPVYPKFDGSWILSEEPFMPAIPGVNTVRLRLAFGHSGNQASQNDILNNYILGQGLGRDGSTIVGIAIRALGNPELRPERTTEVEGGFDISLLGNDRLRLEGTLYRKLSRDAIMPITHPPSFGIGSAAITFSGNLSQRINVGSIENRGAEVSATARVVEGRSVTWESSVSFSKNSNTLVAKDPRLANLNAFAQFRVGYPVYSRWGYQITSYTDANGDGLLAYDEAAWSDTTIFFGTPYPESELTLRNDLSLMRGALRFAAVVDQLNGLSNTLSVTYSSTFPSWGVVGGRGMMDPTAPLAMQANAMQALRNRAFMGQSSALRLSEVSATVNVPPRFTQRYLRARSVSLTLAGRNLALWTNYISKDPNVDASWFNGIFSDVTSDNGSTIPQTRNWALRLNLGF